MQPSNIIRSAIRPLNTADRNRLFGRFDYKHAPTPQNKEAIKVTGGWAKENLITIPLGAWEPAQGADNAVFHRLVAPRVQELVAEIERLGFSQDVLTFNGSYVPRLVRGTTIGTLSAHSWGTAFDINAKWNRLGVEPALVGSEGSVLRIVPVAEKLGFFWGGRFSRKDGMHFELSRV
jgi:hypothetical protein